MRVSDTSIRFLEYLDRWMADLPDVALSSLLDQYGPETTALVSVDVVNGFCKEGNLASPRVGAIVPPVVKLFEKAESAGIPHFVLLQDTHPHDSKEFKIYPPHCMEGSKEARTVSELTALPFSNSFRVIPKKTICPGLEIQFQHWLKENPQIRQFLIVGDCTDICVYLLSVLLKCWFVENAKDSQIVVPEDCVNTFDIPVSNELPPEVLPHPADLLHAVFLYHMQTNGIRIVRTIT